MARKAVFPGLAGPQKRLHGHLLQDIVVLCKKTLIMKVTNIRPTTAKPALADPPMQNGGITRTLDALEKARAYKEEIATKLFGVRSFAVRGGEVKIPEKSNIVGLGFGAKSVGGALSDGGLAVRVYVRTKFAACAHSR